MLTGQFIEEEVLDAGEVVRGLDPGVLGGVESFAVCVTDAGVWWC